MNYSSETFIACQALGGQWGLGVQPPVGSSVRAPGQGARDPPEFLGLGQGYRAKRAGVYSSSEACVACQALSQWTVGSGGNPKVRSRGRAPGKGVRGNEPQTFLGQGYRAAQV